jgi:hypothetical protein
MGDAENRIIAENPDAIFRHAVKAYAQGNLDGSWLRSFPTFSETMLKGPWLDRATSTGELAGALAILCYPRRLSKSSEEISRSHPAARASKRLALGLPASTKADSCAKASVSHAR